MIKIDQQSLKYLLEQKVGTPFQQKWITKLLGYGFKVEYKKGVDNKVADALSRREGWDDEVSISVLSMPVATWVDKVKEQYLLDSMFQDLLQKWHSNNLDPQKYSFQSGLLLYKGRILLGTDEQLKQEVLHYLHSDPLAGHSGYERTMQRARKDFYWKGMKRDLKSFNRECLVSRTSMKIALLLAAFNRFPFPPRSGLTSAWILLKVCLVLGGNRLFWWLSIVYPSKAISPLWHTLIQQLQWLTFSLQTSSSYTACQVPLSLTEISPSQVPFGGSFFSSKVLP